MARYYTPGGLLDNEHSLKLALAAADDELIAQLTHCAAGGRPLMVMPPVSC
jgi:hypothetical protein